MLIHVINQYTFHSYINVFVSVTAWQRIRCAECKQIEVVFSKTDFAFIVVPIMFLAIANWQVADMWMQRTKRIHGEHGKFFVIQAPRYTNWKPIAAWIKKQAKRSTSELTQLVNLRLETHGNTGIGCWCPAIIDSWRHHNITALSVLLALCEGIHRFSSQRASNMDIWCILATSLQVADTHVTSPYRVL